MTMVLCSKSKKLKIENSQPVFIFLLLWFPIDRKIDVFKGPKMDLELDLGPFRICGKDRTEGPFLAEDR